MKKALAVASALAVALMAATNASAQAEPPSGPPHAAPGGEAISQADTKVNKSLDVMAKLLATTVTDQNLRQKIHQGVAKRFDGDTNVLFSSLSSMSKVRSELATEYGRARGLDRSDARSAVDRLADDIPRFQIAVPANFSAWDPVSFTPLVGYMPVGVEDTELDTVTAYDAEGRKHLLDAQVEPDQPVIIVGVNERTDDSGNLLENQVAVSSDAAEVSAAAAGPYAVRLRTVHLEVDHEPWSAGDAEISYRAKSNGCAGVTHIDYDVTGLDNDGNNRTWWDGAGLNLGSTSCPVIMYWWEDDSGNYDFDLSYAGVGLGVQMANGDDLIGGHQFAASYFKGTTEKWYDGLDDIWWHWS